MPLEKRRQKNNFIWRMILAVMVSALVLALSSCGGPSRDSEEIVEDLVIAHASDPDDTQKNTKALLKELKSSDREAYKKWSEIMEVWRSVNTDLQINYDKLPDGLPQTDELCLVALGFALMPDGTMKEELVGRLRVLKNCAEQYPNALIVCTGGGTAAENKAVTEAGQMADWLLQHGIEAERIIVEDKSITTAQNAQLSYEILTNEYPQVTQLAIISSDYHIATGQLLFDAEAILEAEKPGKEKMKVVSNAAYMAPAGTLSEMFQAGALIELEGDKDTAFDIYYGNYDIHELPDPDQ